MLKENPIQDGYDLDFNQVRVGRRCIDRPARRSNRWRIKTNDPSDLKRDFNLDLLFPKPKIHESCVWRICIRSRAERDGAIVAELPPNLTQNHAPAKTE